MRFHGIGCCMPPSCSSQLSHFLNVMPMVFAEAGDPANMSQETLLQQQQELEKELDRLNTRLQEVREQLGRLAQTPAPQQPDDQRQTQSQLQEEEADHAGGNEYRQHQDFETAGRYFLFLHPSIRNRFPTDPNHERIP